MFTGIIEERGSVVELSAGGKLKVAASRVLEDTRIGDSIAVSGVCLTVVELDGRWFAADVMPETLRSSTLGGLRPGARINLERAMGAGGRFGGHLVNGHVDGVGTVHGLRREANAIIVEIAVPEELSRCMVARGSVAIDGVSLTIVDVRAGHFTVSVIPHTLEETTLSEARPGAPVNVEVDIIGKYVDAFLTRREGRRGMEEALLRGGFLEPGQDM